MPDGDFRLAGAYVEVNLKDNTAGDEAKIRARLEKSGPIDFETSLKDPDNLMEVRARIEAIGSINIAVKADPDLGSAVAAGAEMAKFTEAAADGTRRRMAQAGVDSGTGFVRGFTGSVDAAAPARIRTDADTTLARAKIKELAAARNAAVISIDADISKAVARIKDLEGKRGNTKIDVDAEVKRAEAKIAALRSKKGRILVEVEVDKTSLAKAAVEVDSAMESVASRANAQFKALAFAAAFAGLPAAVAVGAAGAVAALAVVPLAFVGLAIAGVAATDEVSTAFRALSVNVDESTTEMSAVMAGPLATAAGDLGASFDRLKPQILTAMAGSVPAVKQLTGTVTDLAENAMPGLVVAVKASEAPLKGLRSFAGQAGAGVTDLFVNISKGSASAGTNMSTLGSITRELLGFTGTLLANLSNGGTAVLPQFGGALHQVEGILTTITSSGMPALQGATSGFLGTVGGGLNIVQGFSSALGGWAAPLGSASGSLFAVNSMAKLFGTSLGETGFGLKAFSSSVDDAGKKTSPFKDALSTAEKDGTSKFKAGTKAIVDSGLNPLGIALIAGGFLLDAWGKESQKAAADAADFNKGVSAIRNTLTAGSGAVTQATREYAAQNLITKELGDTHKTGAKLAQEYGLSTEISTQAAVGNSSALHQVDAQLRKNVESTLNANLSQDEWNALQEAGVTKQDAVTLSLGGAAGGFKNLDEAIQSTNGTEDDHLIRMASAFVAIKTGTAGQREFWTEITRSNAEVSEAQRQMRTLGEATSYTGDTLKLSAGAAGVLSAALVKIGDDATSAADSGSALLTVLNLLSGGTISLSDAQAKSHKAFDDVDKYLKALHDGGVKAKASFAELVNGDGGINGLTSKGAALNGVFQGLLSSMGTEASAVFTTSHEAGDSLATSMDKVNAVVGASRGKFIDAATAAGLTETQAGALADQMGLIPQLVDISFAAHGDVELQQKLTSIAQKVNSDNEKTIVVKSDTIAGAEEQLKALGYKLTAMPNGEVRITAPNAPKVEQDVTDIIDKVNTIPAGKTVTLKAVSKEAEAQLTTLGFTVTHLPDGTITVTSNTTPATDAAHSAVGDINQLGANVTVDSVTNPATAGVIDWQRATSSVKGQTTTYTSIDPATGQVREWKGTTDATGARTTVFSSTDPATGAVRSWQQNTNGTWAEVTVKADVAAAAAAIDNAARSRTATIYVQTKTSGSGAAGQNSAYRANADGGILSAFAGGGFSGLTPMTGGLAEMVQPDTWRLVGDNMKVPEAYIPIDPGSRRSQSLLAETNAMMGSQAQGSTVVHNYHNTFHLPETDIHALAAAVSREQEIRAKTGAY